jgi:hypothetical protein
LNNQAFRTSFRDRRGVSAIVTALIALVAVLGTVVFFLYPDSRLPSNNDDAIDRQVPATSSPQTSPPQPTSNPQDVQRSDEIVSEAIQVSNGHIWIAPNGTSSAAGFVVKNTGATVVAIQTVTIRKQAVPTSSWFYNTADATAANIGKELSADFTLNAVNIDGAAGEEIFNAAAGPISLSPGTAVFVYLVNPANMTAIDSGLAFSINVQAGKASAVQAVSVING